MERYIFDTRGPVTTHVRIHCQSVDASGRVVLPETLSDDPFMMRIAHYDIDSLVLKIQSLFFTEIQHRFRTNARPVICSITDAQDPHVNFLEHKAVYQSCMHRIRTLDVTVVVHTGLANGMQMLDRFRGLWPA